MCCGSDCFCCCQCTLLLPEKTNLVQVQAALFSLSISLKTGRKWVCVRWGVNVPSLIEHSMRSLAVWYFAIPTTRQLAIVDMQVRERKGRSQMSRRLIDQIKWFNSYYIIYAVAPVADVDAGLIEMQVQSMFVSSSVCVSTLCDSWTVRQAQENGEDNKQRKRKQRKKRRRKAPAVVAQKSGASRRCRWHKARRAN